MKRKTILIILITGFIIFIIILFVRFVSHPSLIYVPEVLPKSKNLSLFSPTYRREIKTDASFGSKRDSIYMYSFNDYSIISWSILNYNKTPLSRVSINRNNGFAKSEKEIYGRIDWENLSILTNGKDSNLDSLIINFDVSQELTGTIRDSSLLYQKIYFKNIEIKGTVSGGQILITSNNEPSSAQFALYKKNNRLFIILLWSKVKNVGDNDLLLKLLERNQ